MAEVQSVVVRLDDDEQMFLGRDNVGGDRRVSRHQATLKNIGGGIIILTQLGTNKSILVRDGREMVMAKNSENVVVHNDILHLHQSKECGVKLKIVMNREPEDTPHAEAQIKRQQVSFSPLSSMVWRLSTVNRSHGLDNTGCVSILQLLEIPPKSILFADYMIDELWLQSAFPYLKSSSSCPTVTLWLDQKSGGTMRVPQHWNVKGLQGLTRFGCHHSKLIIAGYPTGMRIIIHTANLLYGDINCKTQGIWWQDFPFGKYECESGFGHDLIDYISKCDSECWVLRELRKVNFSNSTVDLVPSVPGRHSGKNITKYGHMRLRQVVKNDSVVSNTTILQCSSLGSLTAGWMSEFCTSLATPQKNVKMVWPTVDEVRRSLEGYNAGACIPGTASNVDKLESLIGPFYKWGGTPREHAAPHIKTYTSICELSGIAAWSCLTSANLSGAAWGRLEKKGSQLYIMHYELGVVRKKSHRRPEAIFSLPQGPPGVVIPADAPLALAGSIADPHIGVPLPFKVPPTPYNKASDLPWKCDQPCAQPDAFGFHGPTGVSLYGIPQDS
eukprot:TRINITY_DN33541_c0_g1_i1.p1 TRINITY_DN33541_c0_g1~~TRINITY_DN33541_c0_g1_i1.p1  ORF type:complete len:556 (+),score=60.12 TRINITY_DN33541_c0_g1_i1:37-1704(+)